MEKLRRIFVILFVAMVSLVGFAGCGDPYKDMRLTIDNGAEGAFSKTIVYDADDEVEDSFSITATVSGVGGGVDKGVIFTSHDTNVIVLDGDSSISGGNSTQKFRIITTGETYITITTKEGNLSETVNVNVIAYADRISLIHEGDSRNSLPIIKGNKTDLTKIASNKGQAFINFTPAYTTERNVSYEVFADASGMVTINESSDTYSIDGNNITFNKSYNVGSVYLRATYKDAEGESGPIKTGYTKVTLLDPINIADYKLMYSYAKDNTVDGSNVIELIEVEKSAVGDVDYQIYLADQYAGDANNDSKNLFLVRGAEGGNETFASVLDSTDKVSFTKVDKSTNNHVYTYSSTILGKVTEFGNPIPKPGFILCNGSGEGNNDTLYFNINYRGFEEYFDGVEISVRVTIDAFPAGVVIGLDDSITNNYWYEQERTIDVYNNYVNKLGSAFYVKVLNNAHETVTSQYAYVGIMGFMDNNEFVHVNELEYGESNEAAKSFSRSADSYFTIYDSNGNIVTPYTKVKSGSQLFIKYNPQIAPEFFDEADFVLYARSILDPTITTFNLATAQDGNLAKDPNTYETYFYNTLNEMILNYTVNLEDIEIFAGDTDSVKIEIKNASGIKYGTAENIPSVKDDLEYILNGNGIVGWVGAPGVDMVFDTINGCYRIQLLSNDDKKVGGATLTVIAPNGHYDTIDINVTINPIAAAEGAKLLVGNMTLVSGDTQYLQMNVGASVNISVLFDGVLYPGMLPYGFRLPHISSGNFVIYNNNKLIAGDIPTKANTPETHKFQLFYKNQQIGEYTINIQVVRPVNYLTRSHANVYMFYSGSVANITDKAVGDIEIDQTFTNAKGETVKYININEQTKSVVTFEANPNNSTLDLSNVKLEIGLDTEWQEVRLGALQGGYYGDPAGREEPDYYFKPSYNATPVFEFGNDDDESSKKLIEIGLLRVSLETVEGKNCIRLYLDDVVYKAWNMGTGRYTVSYSDLKFKVRLTYTQEHDLILSKRYYVGGGYNGSSMMDSFFLYTDINNPSASRVTYVGGYKFVSANKNTTINGEFGSFTVGDIKQVNFGGVSFTIARDAVNEVWFFDYNKYKIDLPVNVNYLVKAPVKTSKIEFGGVDALGQNKYLKTLNKNQLNSKFAFEYTYTATPERSEIPGLLFRYDYYDTVEAKNKTMHMSQLYYQNLEDNTYTRTPEAGKKYRVIGAITTESFTGSHGLLIYMNYLTKKISAVITCNPNLLEINPNLEGYDPLLEPENPIDKFIALMSDNNNRINLQFISVDSYAKTPLYVTLQFELRTGSADNPYTVSSIEEFDNIRYDLDSSYQLISDLDFKDVTTWTPINNFKGNLFSGTYNDSTSYCYKIKNFRMSLSTVDGLGGIFGSAEGVSFQNIVFENFYLEYDADECESPDGSVHVGYLVGKARECSIKNCTFKDSDTNYSSYDISRMSTRVEHGVYIQDSTKALTYYVGGIFGSFSVVNNVDQSVSGINASINIYSDVTNTYSQMHIGGLAGQGNINMSEALPSVFNIVIYANTGRVESAGAIVGNITTAATTIANVEITTYIVAMNNVGGAVGSGASTIKISNATFTGYLQGKQNMGGFVGYAASDVELTSCKVQFTYRDINTMKYRSGIVGDNNLGGLVGFANAKFVANYSSVMTYVDYSVNKYNVLNRANALDEATHTETEKSKNYYGDITVLTNISDVNMGGFVGVANNRVEVNSGYFNAHATVYSTAKVYFGGIVGNFQNGDNTVQNGGLTITYTAVNGDIYHNQEVGSIIGGFVGVIKNGLSLHSYDVQHNYGTYPVKEGVQTENLTPEDYNIRNSYSFLKTAKLGSSLTNVENFAGLNEEVDTDSYKKKIFKISLSYRENSLSGNRIFVLRYETPISTRYDTFAFSASSIGVDGNGYLHINMNFGSSLSKNDSYFSNINEGVSGALFSLVWDKTTDCIAQIKFKANTTGAMSTYKEIYSYSPKKTVYTVPNVLALNSFYEGYKTDVRIFNYSGYTTKLVESYEFKAVHSTANEITVDEYSFDYFTQRAKMLGSGEVFYSTFDNLQHKAHATGANKVELNVTYAKIVGNGKQLYPYLGSDSAYIKYVHENHTDASTLASINLGITSPTSVIAAFTYNSESGVLPTNINDAYINGLLNERSITSVASIFVDEYYHVIMDNHAYVVTNGTALNGKTNRDVYDPNRDAVADPSNPDRYVDRYKWYVNTSSDKDQIINGLPIPFQSYLLPGDLDSFLSSDIPLLVIDVPSREINSTSNEYYLDMQNIASKKIFMLTYYGVDNSGVSDSRNTVAIADVLTISTIPELANERIIYTSDNLSVVRIVNNENMLIMGEGNAVITAKSALSGLSLKFNVVVMAYDHHAKYWEISTMNNPLTNTGDKTYEAFIPIDAGDVINFDNGYTGQNIFGVRFEFNTADVVINEIGRTVEDFLRTLNISGNLAIYWLNGSNVVIQIDGLTHAISCNILGSVEIKQTLYVKYKYDGVTYTYDIDEKTTTYAFVESVYGITGADEFNIYTLDTHTFSVVVDCDSESPKLNLLTSIIGDEREPIRFNEIKNNQVFKLSDYNLGYLTIEVVNISFDQFNKLKTYTFRVSVDEDEQTLIQKEFDYNLRFVVDDYTHFYHDVKIGLKPQNVESIYINHYTNVFFTANQLGEVPEEARDSYKYPSEIIIPGYTSLLQVNLYPHFGRFDYITAESDTVGIVIGQVLEVYNSKTTGDVDNQYSWYEYYSKGQTVMPNANGIITVAKTSYKDAALDPSSQLGYNGTLFFALSADTKLSSYQIKIIVKGYINNNPEAMFSEEVTLKVEARPTIIISGETREIMFGDTVDIDIETINVDSDFTASLKVDGVNNEYIDVLGSIIANGTTYKFRVNDTTFVYEMFHQYMFKEITLKVMVSKVINGVVATDSSEIKFLLIPYKISNIYLNLEGIEKTNSNVIVDYYQPYEVVITAEAEYSQGYGQWLNTYHSHDNINKKLEIISDQIKQNIANFSVIKQGTSVSRRSLLSPGQTQYTGDVWLNHDTSDYSLSIKFIKTEMADFIWADVGIEYTLAGVAVVPHERGKYLFSDYFSASVYTNSTEDTPDPITSVEEFKNMEAGVNYILMADLYLAMWEPINANFKSLDGNGYVITLVSFADISSMKLHSNEYGYNIGIFSQISADTTIRNLTIEINPSPSPMDFTQDKAYDDVVNESISKDYTIPAITTAHNVEYANSLDVDISSIKTQTNFGVLAGTNLGTVTNVSITNNASALRKTREDELAKITNNRINIEDADDFTTAINKFAIVGSTDTIKVSYMFENKDETSSRNNKISLLVGTNAGFITNSNAENVSISGEDYVAGLVGQNIGKISSSFFKGGNIVGDSTTKSNSGNGGLVALNSGEIYYSYVEGKASNASILGGSLSGIIFSDGEYRGSGIITNSYAGGFAFQNSGKINNCYAKILVSGIYASGFVYECVPGNASIEYCYAMSNVQANATTNTPFLKRKNVKGANIVECYYLYDSKISNLAEDVAESVAKKEFNKYSTFASYAFNTDYYANADILDAVWFIPGGEYAEVTKRYFKQAEYSGESPQLVSANQRTLSIRYMSGAEEESSAYTYSWVPSMLVGYTKDATPQPIYESLLRGSITNPLLINSASGFNTAVIDGTDNRRFRLIKDISFTENDEVATTYSATFTGKLDGNGMTIGNLRISADEVQDEAITKLGLFKEIKGSLVRSGGKVVATVIGQESKYAVVKNLNIEVSQINGMTVNMVGVLAGEITDAKIYNVSITGEDYTVQGLNAVGAIAGRVLGDTDMVNISSNVSVKSNYFYQYNAFSKEFANTDTIQKFHTYVNYDNSSADETNIKYISYAGGIAGIIDVDRFETEGVDSLIASIRQEMYRLRRLSTTGDITIEGEVVGGLFGYLSNTSNVSDCDLVVTDYMSLKGSRASGGFVGHNEGDIKNCTVVNANQEAIDDDIEKNIEKYDNATTNYDIGAQNLFTGNAMFIGGIAGMNFGGTIEKTYNRVNVACQDSLYAGGIVGLTVKGTYKDLYVTGSVSAFSAIGGMMGIALNVTADKELNNVEEVGFFMGNAISDINTKLIERLSTKTALVENVVLSNIWKYSHLNVIRSTIAKPNAQPASIGMLVGFVYNIPNITAEKAPDPDQPLLAENYVKGVLGSYKSFTDRVLTDNIIYKQTFTYQSLQSKNKIALREIGNQDDDALLSIFDITYFDNDVATPNTTGQSYVYGSNNYIASTATNFSTFISNNTRYISGKYRVSDTDVYDEEATPSKDNEQSYYIFSRMTAYGSLRSLNEIYQRKYDYVSANKFYEGLGSDYNNYRENVENISNVQYNTSHNDGTARYKALSIYSNWDSEKWYGVGLTLEGLRAEDEYLYPEYKNATIDTGAIYIYSFKDFYDALGKGASLTADELAEEYVLMNDIYWDLSVVGSGIKWKPIGTKGSPFKGIIRSAKVGDADGTNVVTENRTFTIFNVNFGNSNVDASYIADASGDSTGGSLGIFGYASRATFQNINIHTTGIDTTNKEYEYVGTLVGCATEFCTFSNITVFGSSNTISGAIGSKTNWGNSTDTITTVGGSTVVRGGQGYYKTYDQILTAISGNATIKTTRTAFVGGIAGYAGKSGFGSDYESYYVNNGGYNNIQVRSSALSAYNLTLDVSGNGSASGYHHYVGGAFGYVSIINPSTITSLGGYSAGSYKYFTVNVENVEIGATLTGTASTKTLQQASYVSQGVYVGAYAGYINTNGLNLNGVGLKGTTINVDANEDKLTTNSHMVAVGGLFGFASEVSINNMLVNGEVEVNVDEDRYSQIGGLVGHGERLDLSNVIISEDIIVDINNNDASSVIKYYGGIVGNLLISNVNNLVAKESITLTISNTSNYYSGGLAGRITFAGTNIAKVILNDVTQSSGNATIVGGLIGLVEESGNVTQCYVAGTISSTSATAIGGLIGRVITTTEGNGLVHITGCVSNVNITNTLTTDRSMAAGGIVGDAGLYNGANITNYVTPIKISDTYNSGTILTIYDTNVSIVKMSVGGILGSGTLHVYRDTNNTGRVTNIGNIYFGYKSSDSTSKIYSLISGANNSMTLIGGIVGNYKEDASTKDSLKEAYYNKDLVEITNAYGVGKTTEEIIPQLSIVRLAWINNYIDSSIFANVGITVFVQGLQAIGTKANPIVVTETLTQTIINDNDAIIFNGSTVAGDLEIRNKHLYFTNSAMTSNPAFKIVDAMSFVWGLKLNISSTSTYVLKENHGYLVDWEISTINKNIVGSNTGVIINWDVKVTAAISNNTYLIANNYDTSKTGIILYSKFEINCGSSNSKDIKLFRSSNSSYAILESNGITNSVVQCQITYLNSSIDSTHFNTTLNKTLFNDCIKDAYTTGGDYISPFYINKVQLVKNISTYSARSTDEYDISNIFFASYDFGFVYTWLDSTQPVSLQVFEKDHFNDKQLTTASWKEYAKTIPAKPSQNAGVVEVSSTDALVYALYNFGNTSYTIKYTGDAQVDLGGKLWTPIEEFTATLDMGGAVIDNVMIIVDTSTYTGFIKTLNNGTIKDVTFRNINIVSLDSDITCIGSVAGTITGNSVLSRVGVEGFTVYEKGPSAITGALAGKIETVEGKNPTQINDAYVAVEYVNNAIYTNHEICPLTTSINSTYGSIVLNNYYAYGYLESNIMGTPFYTMSIDSSKVNMSNGNTYLLDSTAADGNNYEDFVGVKAEEKLPYFDFINDWTSAGNNTNSIDSNFGLPRLNTKVLTKWEDVVTLEGYTYTETSYITISNAVELAQFAKWVNTSNVGKNFTGTVYLASDIDLSRMPAAAAAIPVNENDAMLWTPIGIDSEHSFKGTFIGNGTTGKTIYGLSSSGTDVAGLFGYVDGATIKNITFTGYNSKESSTINERLGARVSIEPNAGTKGYAGIVAGYAKNSTIQDITITGLNSQDSKYYRSYVKLNNRESAYLGGVVGCAVSTTLFNNKVEGCLYDGDATTSQDKTMISIETKFADGKPVAMGGIVGAILDLAGSDAKQSYAMSNVVKDVNIVNKSNMKKYDYGSGEVDLKYYDQIYAESNRSEVLFGTGGIAGMSRNSRIVSNNVQTFLTVGTNSNALGGIVGQVYGGTVQESVAVLASTNYSIATANGTKGVFIGYGAKAEAFNLYAITSDSSLSAVGSTYMVTNADSNTMSADQIRQEELNGNWYNDGTNHYKLSDTFRLSNYSVLKTNLGEAASGQFDGIYSSTGQSATNASATRVYLTSLDKNIKAGSTAWSTGNILFTILTGETTSKTYMLKDVDVFLINADSAEQEKYFAVNSDYYKKAETVQSVKSSDLLFNWSCPGDILLGDPYYRETAAGSGKYVSQLGEHKHFNSWLASLLRFRPNIKEIAFDMNLDFNDDGPITNIVSTKEYPFGSRTRVTTITGHNINLEINEDTENNVGLFGYGINLQFENINTVKGYVTGKYRVGALVGYADNMLLDSNGVPQMIEYKSITGMEVDVTGQSVVGGVIGEGYFIKMSQVTMKSNAVKATSHVDLATYYSTDTYGLGSAYGFNATSIKSREVVYEKDSDTLDTITLAENFALFKYENWDTNYWGSMTGGVIGLARYNVVMENVEVASTSQLEASSLYAGYVGGLIGDHNEVVMNTLNEGYLQMKYSKFEGSILSDNSAVFKGGLIGYTSSGASGFTQGESPTYSQISYCQAGAESTTTQIKGDVRIAGITPQFNGIVEHTTNYYIINNTGSKYYEGDSVIASAPGSVAGIVAAMNGEIRYCTNYGNITSHQRFTGGVVGYLTGGINNCENNGQLTIDALDNAKLYIAGGIAGYLSLNDCAINGSVVVLREVYKCTNNGVVISASQADNSYVGGIIGFATKGVKIGISSNVANDSYETTGNTNTANITSRSYVGGIVGYADNTTRKFASEPTIQVVATEISYNKSEGHIEGSDGDDQYGSFVGGIVGRFDSIKDGIISYNVNDSTIGTYNGSTYVGGIVGYMTCGSLIGNENNGDIGGYNYVGGIVGIMSISEILDATITEIEVYFSGNINHGEVAGQEFIGGLAGCVDNKESRIIVQFVDNTTDGMVAGTNEDNNDELIGFIDGYNIYVEGENMCDSPEEPPVGGEEPDVDPDDEPIEE